MVDTPKNSETEKQSFVEFVMVMALAMSLVALSIDAILPALSVMGRAFNITQPNYQQFVITSLFIGLSFGQLIAGPLSDAIGRKRAMYMGLGVFIIGSVMSWLSQDYTVMLAGRFIQGLGAAAPRVVTVAMVRDKYVGRDMARVMSYIMGVFILVPILAPAVGQAVMMAFDWRGIFWLFIGIAMTVLIWSYLRLSETLAIEDRRPFNLPTIGRGLKTVCTNRMTICYTVAAGFMFGGLLGYINTAQQVFQGYYNTGDMFAIYFAVCAASLGASFFVNALVVKKFGMRYIILLFSALMAVISICFIGYEFFSGDYVPFFAFLAYIMASSFCMGMCFGNLNALAMVPMGHLAGLASAAIGALSLVFSIVISSIVGQFFDETLYPLSFGFLTAACIALTLMYAAEGKGKSDETVHEAQG